MTEVSEPTPVEEPAVPGEEEEGEKYDGGDIPEAPAEDNGEEAE